MEALNNGVVETDVIMEVPTLVEIVSVQPLQVDVTEEPKIIIEELTEQSEVNEPKEDTLKDVDCEPEKQITQAAEAQPCPRQIVQVPPEASVESNTEATGGNIANNDLAESEPIVIEEIRLSTVADVPVPSQTAQKQPEAVEPDVPKIDQAQHRTKRS